MAVEKLGKALSTSQTESMTLAQPTSPLNANAASEDTPWDA